MNIHFILPAPKSKPAGGYKMVYMYANELSKRGHNVAIVYLNDRSLAWLHLPELLRRSIMNAYSLRKLTWFTLSEKIKLLSATSGDFRNSINDVDIAIATEVHTIEPVTQIYSGKKICYFIQGFENWTVSEKYVYKTYGIPCTKIVVSKWLKSIVDKYSPSPSVLVSNSVDQNIFRITVPIEKRYAHSIAILYHENPVKGVEYSLKSVLHLKSEFPDLIVKMFGVFKRPKGLPEWILYESNLSQEQVATLYNSVAILLCATTNEGFGLTGLEAMACGTALVSTDYDGVREYAISDENALLSPIKDVAALSDNVRLLFENNDERIRIAYNGVKTATSHDLGKMYNEFEQTIVGKKTVSSE